jgi:predicted RNA-binding Zn-ribbon protein involved in translation (DUF1610 family)
MSEREPAIGHWEQLNKCPSCGADMAREPQVGEQMGLTYRCNEHGRFQYSWDHDRLEPVPQRPA